MALIQCPQCHAEYDVQLKVLEKNVTCKECGKTFRAQARKSAKKPKKKNNTLWIVIGACAALFMVIMIVVYSGSDDDITPSDPPENAGTADVDRSQTKRRPDPRPPPRVVGSTEAEKYCISVVAAIADSDLDKLQDMVNFPLYHNARSGGEGSLWSDLDQLNQILRKQKYLDILTAETPEGAGFARNSAVEEAKELACTGSKAEVELLLKNMLNDRRQVRTYRLVRIGAKWTVADQIVGAEYGGDLDIVTEEGPKTLDEKYGRRVSPEGLIGDVPFLDDTSEAQRKEMARLVANLTGDDRNLRHEAQERLVKMGKPAIPPLLTGLAPFDFNNQDHISDANKIIGVLRQITGRSFGFAPGFQDVAIRGSMEEDLKHAVRLWFGWWARYKDVWEGRDIKKEMEGW
jgi:predicted Zn finger-like uncharacterized protein